MDKQHLAIILALIIGIAFLGWLTSTRLRPMTLLSANIINLDPKGYLDSNNKLRGTYWSIVLIPSFSEEVGVYKFDDVEAHQSYSDPYWQSKNMSVRNEIVLRIRPERPYYSRKLTLSSVQVTPPAYQNWLNWLGQYGRDKNIKADALYSGHYQFAEADWTLHTPFYLELLVNGEVMDYKIIDTVGAVETVTIGKAPNIVTISNLGKLSTGYTAPVWQDIVYFNNQYFYLYDKDIIDAMTSPYPVGTKEGGIGVMPKGTYEDTYAWYWYGFAYRSTAGIVYRWDRYWKDEGDVSAITEIHPGKQDIVHLGEVRYEPYPDPVPGWVDSGGETGVTRVRPLSAPRFPPDKPAGKEYALSLVEWLERVAGATKPLMPSWLPNPQDIVVEDSVMKLYLPFGSMNNLLQVLVSTEIADTVVWHPLLSNIKITKFEDFGDVFEQKKWSITVKQEGTLESGGTIWFSVNPSSLAVGVDPPTIGTGDLSNGQTKTFWFTIKNLAVLKDTEFSITARVTNSLGAETDSKTTRGTAKARSGVTTTLVVYTLDARTRNPVGGVFVTVAYDSLSKTAATTAGAVTFDFGSTTPTVTVTTTETTTYQSASASKQLVTGPNTVELLLYEHGETPPPEIPLWAIVLAAVVVVGVIVIIVYKKYLEV